MQIISDTRMGNSAFVQGLKSPRKALEGKIEGVIVVCAGHIEAKAQHIVIHFGVSSDVCAARKLRCEAFSLVMSVVSRLKNLASPSSINALISSKPS